MGSFPKSKGKILNEDKKKKLFKFYREGTPALVQETLKLEISSKWKKREKFQVANSTGC